MTKQKTFETVDAQTFGSVMGQAVWLMTLSKTHRELPIKAIEGLISPAILLRQFKLYSKGKQPVAFLIWASVTDEVKAVLDAGGQIEKLEDWRSGPNIVVVDCISPLAPRETFEEKFLTSLKAAQTID
ncbi:MAG: toxin-activating lysine-acyltransferase [Paracoccaceae bacterium]